MENDPQQRKPIPNYLQGLPSLPDNRWSYHRPNKVTELPHRHTVAQPEGIEDNVVLLPRFPKPDIPDQAA